MKLSYNLLDQGAEGNGLRLLVKLGIIAAGLFVTVFPQSATAQTLLAGYDFQTTTSGGTAAAAAPGSPLVYYSGFGLQTGSTGGAAIYLDGTNGSSAFTSLATNPQVTAFNGTAVNAGTGFSTTTSGASALAVANSSAVGNRIVFTLSTTGYQNVVLSFATLGSSTGFKTNQFSYSTDGSTFTNFGATVSPPTSTPFSTVTEDFSSITALNNATTIYIGYTLAGATSASGNNRLDNIQFNASAITVVPEPSTYLGGGLMIGAFGWSQRRRLASLKRSSLV